MSGGSGPSSSAGPSFTESQILANVYADVLNAAGFEATVQTVGQREAYLPALQRGEFQVFPEYVGTLAEYLDGNPDEAVVSGDLDASVETLRGRGRDERADLRRAGRGGRRERLRDHHGAAGRARRDHDAVRARRRLLGRLAGARRHPGVPDPAVLPAGPRGGLRALLRQRQDSTSGPPTNQALQQGEISLGLALSTDPIFAE